MPTFKTATSGLKTGRPRFFRIVAGVCLLYEAGVLSYLLWHWLGAGDQPALALLGVFLPFLFAPLLLILPVALGIRSRPAMAGALLLVVAFVALYGPALAPKRHNQPALAGADTLRVMTFNLGPTRATSALLLEAIQKENADIIAVQELTTEVRQLLIAELSIKYPYSTLGSGHTVELLSRYPIVESERYPPAVGGRPYLHALIDWHGVLLHVLAVHPWPPGILWFGDSVAPIGLDTRVLSAEMSHVAGMVSTWDGPVIVVGDFNMTEQMPAYTTLAGVLNDAYREAGAGWGFTFPNDQRLGRFRIPFPMIRIDYLFHSDELQAQTAAVGCEGSSDHCYLVTELTLAVETD